MTGERISSMLIHMYAVIELGGRQWKVEPGTQLDVNRLSSDVGATQTVERVLITHDGSAFQVGRPYVEGARVVCEVLAHRQGPKVISYHFRRRENWRKTVGHRQRLTRLLVKDIVLPGGSVAAAGETAQDASAVAKKPAKTTPAPKAQAATRPRTKP